MDDSVCGGLDGDACRCFAANLGGSCIYCPGSRTCRPARSVLAHQAGAESSGSGMCGSAHERRAVAARCGALDINLAVAAGAPPSSTVGLLAPWTGAHLFLQLGAVFHVQGVAANVGRGAGAAIALEPASNMRTPTEKCHGPARCTWSLDKVPFLSNITLDAIANNDTNNNHTMDIDHLVVTLAHFAPLDGTLAPLTPWSLCNNSCGDGVQTRNYSCVQPAFGGLPCTHQGSIVLHHITKTRPCATHTDCGTNWAVMAVVGWWQIILVTAFAARKTIQAVNARRQRQFEQQQQHTANLELHEQETLEDADTIHLA
jgi:hypothetical protein